MKRRYEVHMAVAFALAAIGMIVGSCTLAVHLVADRGYDGWVMGLPMLVILLDLGLAILFFRWLAR